MLHEDTLRLLTPIDVKGAEIEFAADGAALDRIKELLEGIFLEMSPGTSVVILPSWEKILGITPSADSSIEQRQAIVAKRYIAKGDIKKPFFLALADAMGYVVRIEDYAEPLTEFATAGCEVLSEQWEYFSAGVGMAGDYLAGEDPILPWCWEVVVVSSPAEIPSPSLEEAFLDLKPAEIHMNFTYL